MWFDKPTNSECYTEATSQHDEDSLREGIHGGCIEQVEENWSHDPRQCMQQTRCT